MKLPNTSCKHIIEKCSSWCLQARNPGRWWWNRWIDSVRSGLSIRRGLLPSPQPCWSSVDGFDANQDPDGSLRHALSPHDDVTASVTERRRKLHRKRVKTNIQSLSLLKKRFQIELGLKNDLKNNVHLYKISNKFFPFKQFSINFEDDLN